MTLHHWVARHQPQEQSPQQPRRPPPINGRRPQILAQTGAFNTFTENTTPHLNLAERASLGPDPPLFRSARHLIGDFIV